MVSLNANPLTVEAVQSVLEQWPTANHNVHGNQFSTMTDVWQDYQRLMEVYCVVKAGGVAVQVEAAQALLQRETTLLEAEIATLFPEETHHRAAMLRQEIQDLKNSVHWRIEQLQQILPEEEAVVRGVIVAIEARL
ncbi:MAG: hypothetical protein AAF215_23855 [Cyanobacteria bacterium P01_A01_bin.123]